MRRLIVNADDYGLTEAVSRGIRYAHIHGIVSSTTTMINLSAAGEAISAARSECPNLGIGIHLVLSVGKPIRPADRVRSLVGRNGRFHSRKNFPEAFNRLNQGELLDEWTAQIDAILAMGVQPDHIDSHHHISTLHEVGLETMLFLAKQLNVPIRHPESAISRIPKDTKLRIGGEQPGSWLRHLVRLNRVTTKFDVAYPDQTLSCFSQTSTDKSVLISLLNCLPDGTTELMCHPGFVDHQLRNSSRYVEQRKREIEALTHPDVHRCLMERSISLTTFKDLTMHA